MQRFGIFKRFFAFFFRSTTLYGIHSPFVFDFTQNIIEDDRQFYAFPVLESLRDMLVADDREIQVTDYGAGSSMGLGAKRKIGKIARTSLSTPRFCQMLFRIAQHYQPRTILEMGTSLGLSTLYLAKGASSKSKIISLEGCPNIAAVAQHNFKNLESTHIQLRVGPFQDTLRPALEQLQQLDLAFIDGNHRGEATLRYFQQCLQYSHENTILLFDDIHWSEDMEKAWQEIQADPRVTMTIDLFYMGVVFFRSEFKETQHFRIVPRQWKPWVLGFFRANPGQ